MLQKSQKIISITGELMKIIDELRHLKGVKGNFATMEHNT